MSALFISITVVIRSFRRVNIRKAVGPDGIPDRVLRACAFQIFGVSTNIFNLFPLSVCGSPMLQKIHTILPIPKKKTNQKLNYWRPIARTPILSKCFEKLIRETDLLCAAYFTGPTTICITQQPFHRRCYCLHPAHCSLPPGK